MIAIKLLNVVKKYNDKTVINDLSFEIPERSICGFLGANGAGKTTTFKLLSGLIDKESGSIEIYGENITTNNHSKKVRFLRDVPEFYNYMTSREYLKFISELNNLDNIEKLIDENLSLVGLTEYGALKIGSFSRGMKQRLGIAANIISSPEILLLDEPVSALDPIGRREVFELIGKLKGKTTVLFSTHIIDDVEKVCDRLIVIDKGTKIIDGTINDIKKNYLTDMVKINFLNKKDLKIFTNNFKNKDLFEDIDKLIVGITTNDIASLQKDIFSVLNKEKISIQKLDVVTPSLEEIFMKEVLKK